MAETLGSLCDKLTIVKLKQYHTSDEARLESLNEQCRQLQTEIDEYFVDAVSGKLPPERMVFASNKVFKQQGNQVNEVEGQIGEVFYKLADINCRLWHEQEKVYEFEVVPADEKNTVVKQLALLNLERNKCIDAINLQFSSLVLNINKK
jgi:hypothetical protein